MNDLPAISFAAPLTPLDMLNSAVARGADMDVLEKLMALYERWDASQKRRAFDAAIADAKAEIPVISKNREVDFTSTKGRTHYRYEDLGEVARVVSPILGRHGLSYRFRATAAPNEPVVVTCIVSHRDGHFEETTLSAGRDDSGNKNPIQQVGSSLTYLQRMTLKAALGLAASDDDDGRSAGGDEPAGSINEDQVGELRRLIMDADADLPKFLKVLKIGKLDDLPSARFDEATEALNLLIAKRQRAKADA